MNLLYSYHLLKLKVVVYIGILEIFRNKEHLGILKKMITALRIFLEHT